MWLLLYFFFSPLYICRLIIVPKMCNDVLEIRVSLNLTKFRKWVSIRNKWTKSQGKGERKEKLKSSKQKKEKRALVELISQAPQGHESHEFER